MRYGIDMPVTISTLSSMDRCHNCWNQLDHCNCMAVLDRELEDAVSAAERAEFQPIDLQPHAKPALPSWMWKRVTSDIPTRSFRLGE